MKKRILSLALLMCMVLGLTACSTGNKEYQFVTYNPNASEATDVSGKDKSDKNKDEENNKDNDSEEFGVVKIDPFDGLSVSFDGISPYCTISFNNSKCSDMAQTYVQYSVSPDKITTDGKFKINETVTVYASLKNGGSNTQTGERYSLTEESKQYTVKDVPQYITELTADMDLTQLKSEIDDYLTSITAWNAGFYNPMGVGEAYISHSDLKKANSYFSFLKLNAYDKFSNKDVDCFNKVDVTYSVKITSRSWGNPITEPRYFAIQAKNIVLYPDGKIGWGKNDPSALDFENNYSGSSMSDLENSQLISKKVDYNVSDVSTILN